MSADKYPSIFSRQMEAIVFNSTLHVFFAAHVVLKIREYSRKFPSFGWEIFGHVTCLDQSSTSENISQIINCDNRVQYYHSITKFGFLIKLLSDIF